MQIAERVSADEPSVTSERNITLQDTSTHTSSGLLRLSSLFRKLESSSSTMANSETSDFEVVVVARLELRLERAFGHVLDEVVWSRSQLDLVFWGRDWCLAAVASITTIAPTWVAAINQHLFMLVASWVLTLRHYHEIPSPNHCHPIGVRHWPWPEELLKG